MNPRAVLLTGRTSSRRVEGAFVLQAAITACLLFESRALWDAWRDSPFDHFGWAALALWLSPVILNGRISSDEPFWRLGLALTLGVAGAAGSVHALSYWALALAIASFVRWNWAAALWLSLAASWMPALGWMLAPLGPEAVLPVRLALALAAAALLWRWRPGLSGP